jgi:MFS family permease
MTFIGFLPVLIFFVTTLFIPESPNWRQDKRDKKGLGLGVKLKKFCTLWNIWKMFLSILLILSFQLGGIYAMIIFLPITLDKAGIIDFYARAGASIGISGWNIITAVTVVFLVDLLGRKIMLGVGWIVMFVSNFTMAFIVFYVAPPTNGYISIGFVLLFLVGNNGGVGSIVYFIFNELFEPEISLITSSVLFTILNIVGLLVGSFYLPLQNEIGISGMLWIFSGVVFFAGIFLCIFLPETKAKKKEVTPKV